MRDVMLDLETFGLGPTAAIIQLGAVEFDPWSSEVGRKFRVDVQLQSALCYGMTMDQGTLEFWRERGLAGLNQNRCLNLPAALEAFRVWWHEGVKPEETCVWSNGAAFDVPIVEYGCRCVGQATPWHYRNVRDVRTVKWLAGQMGFTAPPEGKPEPDHEALKDCEDQIVKVQGWMRHIRAQRARAQAWENR